MDAIEYNLDETPGSALVGLMVGGGISTLIWCLIALCLHLLL
jgi:hypothetical protein